MEHDKLWNEINSLKEKTYRQETQIEVLKEKVSEEKNLKEKAQVTTRWGIGLLFAIVMSLASWVNSTSESVTRYDERIHNMETRQNNEATRITQISEDVVTVQDWVEENFQKKE